MFESGDSSAVAVVDAIAVAAREENAAGARRLAAIGALYALRAPDDDVERQCWVIDGFTGLVVEVAAALGVSRCRARAQVERAVTLRERLPQVAAVYANGLVDAVLIAMVVSRTDLIIDDAVARRVDAQLAAKMVAWGRLSKPKMEQRIDALIAAADPAGVHAPGPPAGGRYVEVRPCGAGVAAVSGVLSAASAAMLDAVLDQIAGQVCSDDPRSHDQRRADAVDVLAMGGRLRCRCGLSDCPVLAVAGRPAPVVGARTVIHVIATPAALEGHAPGLLPGFGQIPAEQVVQLADGAAIRDVAVPADVAELRYRPSEKLVEFVRCRDLTCRFPGCDRPAQLCDVDHTVPYPAGPTHPSNLKCLCRFHHLVKTFHDWIDHQYPDGTVVWTAPTGHTYVTRPEGAYWFSQLGAATGVVSVPDTAAPSPWRGQAMPTRSRTRVQERSAKILAERHANQERLDEQRHQEQRHREQLAAASDEPPPF